MEDESKETPKADTSPNQEQSFPKEITLTYETAPLFELASAITEQVNHQKVAANNSEGISRKQLKAQKRGNRIAHNAIYVNIGLGIATLGAFVISYGSLTIAKRNADIADKSLQVSIKEWTLENTPILQASKMTVDPLVIGNPLTVQYQIINYGKQIAKLINARISIHYDTSPKFNDFNYLSPKLYPLNVALRGEMNIPFALGDTIALKGGQKDSILKGTLYIYVMSKVTYINTIDSSTKVYSFNYRISLFPRLNFFLLTDDQ